MKLLLITLSALALTLSGCRKCAQCTTTTSSKTTGQKEIITTTVTELCGDDLKDADGNETVTSSTVTGYTTTIRSRTECD